MSEDPQPTEPQRRRFRRTLRRTAFVLAALVLVLAIGLHLPVIQRRLVGLGVARLVLPLGADIQYQDVHYNLFSRSVTLDGVRISAAGQTPLLSATRVQVNFPWSTYRGSLDGLDVTLESADVVLIREHGTWLTIPKKWLGTSGDTSTQRRLPAFAALRMHRVSVRYEDRDAKFVADTRALSFDLVPTGSGRLGDLAGPLGAGGTSDISWYPRVTKFKVLGGNGRYSPEGAGVDDLRVEAAEGVINTNLNFTFHGAERLQLRALGELRGEALKTWLPLLDTLRGPLLVDFRMPATSGGRAFADVVVTGRAVSWQKLLVDDIHAAGALDTGGITLAEANVHTSGGKAEGRGRLAWEDAGQSQAAFSWQDVDAGRVWRTLLASSRRALYVAPGSRVSGRFEGKWDAWHAGALDGHAETTWRARRPGLDRGEHLWLDGKLDARFQHGPWTITVDARGDNAIAMTGVIHTRGSSRDYAAWPLDGHLSLAGGTAPVVLDAFRLADVDVAEWFQHASGSLKGEATLSSTFGDARAALAIQADLAYPDQPPVEFNVRATVDPAVLSVNELTATSGPSKATATLVADFHRDTIDGAFDATRVPVEAWTRRFGLGTPAQGLVDITGHVTGPLAQPLVDASITGGPLVVQTQELSTVEARIHYGDGILHADNLHLVARDGGDITGQGSWTKKTTAVTLDVAAHGFTVDALVPGVATIPSVATVPGVATVSGFAIAPSVATAAGAPDGRLAASIEGDVHISGTTTAPAVQARLRTPALTLSDRSFGPIQAEVKSSSGRAAFDVNAANLGARLIGTTELSGNRAFTVEAQVHSADSPLAARVNHVDVDLGAVDLVAHAAGAASGPTITSADVAVDRLDATVEGVPISVSAGARVSWRPEALDIAGLTFSSGGTRLAVAGSLDGDPRHVLQATLTGRLEDVRPAFRPVTPGALDTFVLEGPFTATLNATGTPKAPSVTGALSLEGARVGDGLHPPVTDIKVRAALDREWLRLEVAEGHWQGAHAAVAGSVPAWFLRVPGAPERGEASLTGHVDDVTIKTLEPFVAPDALRATDFNLRVEYTVGATAPTIEAVVGDLHVTDAELTSGELGLKQQNQGHVTMRGGVATLDAWTIGAVALATTHVTLGGTAQLVGTQTVNGKINGEVDLRTLGLFLGTYRPAGTATISADVVGPLHGPNVDGFVTLKRGELLIRDPRLIFADVNGTVRFSGDQLVVDGVTGSVNGGGLEAHGTMRQPGRGTPSGQIAIAVRGALFDVPRGFRSMVDADLTLAGRQQDTRLSLGGTATIVDAAYRESLIVTGGLLSLFQDQPSAPAARPSGPGPFVLNLRVLADDSILIDTSYGRVAIGGNLRVFGPTNNVRLQGQADIAPGGQIFFGGHTYQIESGRFEFRDPTTITPDVHLVAQTTIGGYNLTMRIDTIDGRTETRLSSDPPLPDDQIASLMISGQRNSTASAGDLVTQQLAAALSGEITSAVGRAIGLDSVRLESGNPADVLFDPSLISADSSPAQRITFSKRILPTLEIIVSQNLRESGQVTWIVNWDVIPRFELRFVQLDTQDRSYEIRHDISFGGGVRERTVKVRAPEKVRDVLVAALGDVSEADVRAVLRITPGRHFDFYKWQEDRDRVSKLFLDRGYYEARITARREPSAPPAERKTSTPVDLGYTIDEGPKTELVITGITPPDLVRRALVQAWIDTPVDALLNEEFTVVLKPWLAGQGYLRSKIETGVTTAGSVKTARLTVTPGEQSIRRVVVYTGNDHMKSSALDSAISVAGIKDRLWTAPLDLQAVVVTEYHKMGYLGVTVRVGLPRFEGDLAELPVQILEGPVFVAGTVRVEDPGDRPAGVDLTPPITPGTVLTDTLVRDAARQLQQRYRLAGYRGTRVTPKSTARSDGATTDLVFRVIRGQRMTFGTFAIAGVEGSERALVEKIVPFSPGQPVSLEALHHARDRLYDTDLFRTVNIDTTPRRAGPGQAASGVMDTRVTVEALPKYRLRYGFQLFDPYRPAVSPKWGSLDPGIVSDLTRRGLFGRGLTAGISGRVNPSDRVARVYVTGREFFGRPAQTNLYIGDEWKRQTSDGIALEQRTRDLTLEQRIRKRGLQLSYGYNFERLALNLLTDVPVTVPLPFPFNATADINAHISRLLGSVYYDQRDSAIDATRGWFHSTSVEFGPQWLGSTQGFRKYLNQDFLFLPLPGTLVLGSAARLEVASGAGQTYIITERLRAGGSSTVRGYDDVTLALVASQQNIAGRTSLLVWNEEIRFPIFRRLRGATFWDHATFFGDLNLPTLNKNRNSVGGGLRLVLPFILVRVDYGYPLNQDPTNDRGRWYFAIGQAF